MSTVDDERQILQTHFNELEKLQLCDTSVFLTFDELLSFGAITKSGDIISPEAVLRRGPACVEYLYREAKSHEVTGGLPDGRIMEAKPEDTQKLLGILGIIFT